MSSSVMAAAVPAVLELGFLATTARASMHVAIALSHGLVRRLPTTFVLELRVGGWVGGGGEGSLQKQWSDLLRGGTSAFGGWGWGGGGEESE